MAELIKQILALPRAEKWHILGLLAKELRIEEEGQLDKIPAWQVALAIQAREEIESGSVAPISHESFWATIDAKVDQLEQGAAG